MWRYLLVVAFGVMLAAARPALAQGPPDKGHLKNLEADIDKLRGQVQNLERLLKKTQDSKAEEGAPERRPGGGGTGAGFYMKKKDGKPMGFGGFGGGSPGAKKKDGKGSGDDWAKKKEEWAKKKKDFPGGGFPGGGFWGMKKDGKGPGQKMQGKGPWADWGKKKAAFGEMSKKSGKGPSFGRPPWATAGFGRGFGGGWSDGRGSDGRYGDIERRLERIQEEIEQLRRELRRR
jgi:hypothetical protein